MYLNAIKQNVYFIGFIDELAVKSLLLQFLPALIASFRRFFHQNILLRVGT